MGNCIQQIARTSDEIFLRVDLGRKIDDRACDPIRQADLGFDASPILTRDRPQRSAHQLPDMSSQQFVGICRIQRFAASGLTFQQGQSTFYAMGDELLVDAVS